MTIIDALINDMADVRLVCGDRWLVGGTDEAEGESFLIVYEKTKRQRRPRCLTETSNEDEAVRWLLGEK